MEPSTAHSVDEQQLYDLNMEISNAENRGDHKWLTNTLAPCLAFQRGNPERTVDDRDAYLRKIAAGGTRETRSIDTIKIYGNRAIITCIVKGNDGLDYHNLRLFIRRDGSWRLLGWANEPA